jgi:hypothetical protein
MNLGTGHLLLVRANGGRGNRCASCTPTRGVGTRGSVCKGRRLEHRSGGLARQGDPLVVIGRIADLVADRLATSSVTIPSRCQPNGRPASALVQRIVSLPCCTDRKHRGSRRLSAGFAAAGGC